MASAIGTALFCSVLHPMLAMVKDRGLAIVRSMADKAGDKAVDKVMDTPMDRAMAMVVDKGDGIVNIERDISNLQITLRMIESIIRVAEEKQIDDGFIQNWLHDLVDIAYEARDVLDDFITFSSCVITAEESSNPVNFISSFIMKYVGGSSSDTSNIPLAILNRLAKDIRSVTERFDVKIKESEKFNTLRSIVGGGGSESVSVDRRPKVGPSRNKQRDGPILGREKVKEGIMDKILHPKNDRVDVVVIWGMGGIGKTTLAQSIYNDERVKKVPRRWLCVGEKKLCAEKVITEIVNDQNTTGIENLDEKLKQKLSGDRFLIVLDDVWDVDGSEWDLLFNPLTEVGNGGLIIITRRERQLCDEITDIQTAYNLEPLSEEDSCSIFESCAYVNGKSDSTPYLKGIGMKIVKKLNGLPLALTVVGRSLLNNDSSIWTNFLESKLTKDNKVMSALRWSYNHLPRHLKTCFTYCSLFPKDHVFYNENVLVEMWMAHDLIQKEEQKRPEDVGAQYFKELVNASLLQCVDGKYVMHDLIHDLSLLVSNGEFATANSSLSIDQMEKVRHITITPGDYSKIPRLCKIEKLLTLYTICHDENDANLFDDNIFKQLKSIRVLVLCGKGIKEIPDCISKLKHLRYLDVRETHVKSLPDSLCHLYNLQMIAASHLFNRVELPIDIVNISRLRYVRASLSTCKGVGKLTSLQELSSIRVCQGDNIRELGDRQRLRGRLSIKGLENVTSSEDAAGALMEKQERIDELELVFDKQLEESTISEEVLDALGCPPNLTYLRIAGYNGLKPPTWMVDGKHKFHKLQILELSHCPKLESLPPLGELTSLKHLYLRSVGVKRLGEEFYGKFTYSKVFFPSLEWLQFDDMKGWEEWDDIIIENSSVSFFPSLTRLVVNECSKLVSLLPVVKNCTSKWKMNATNFMTSLSNLKISKCDGLKRLQLDALVSLKDLNIWGCESLVQITLAICEELRISSCRLLEKMDVARFDSLQVVIKILMLQRCESFRSLSIDIHGLDSLEKLEITDCPKLELAFEDGSSSSSSSGNSVAVPLHNIRTDNTQVFRTLLHHELVSLGSLEITKLGGFENFDETEANNFCESRSLKGLEISQCEDLKSLPADFHRLSSLEKLKIYWCPQLQSLPPDFHKLSSLKELLIYSCPQLQSLPPDFHKLSSLSCLEIWNCNGLKGLQNCDSLVVIKILKLQNCESLRSLSIDIHGLNFLFISGCPTLELAFEDRSSSSSSSGNSVAVPLHYISTDDTQVFRKLLHHKLVSLKSLGIRNLGGFENFDETEANNFCESRSLKVLEISQCEDLKSLPADFHKLSSLEYLSIDHCPQLQSLPPNFHKLSSLSRLKIQNCNGLKRLQLDALVSLKDLDISSCESLVQITSVICEELQISNCRLLEKMDVARYDSLQVVIKILKLQRCESLRSLSIDIHGMYFLVINGCPTLELAFEDGSSSSSCLGNSVAVPLLFISTDNTQVFRTLLHHELVYLESLDIRNLGGFENFDETEANNFCKFRSLTSLAIRQCKDLKSLPADFHKLSSLEGLSIYVCPQLQSLPPDFHKLSSLKSLGIISCPQLQSLPPNFHKLSSLEELSILSCPQLESLPPDFHKLASLKELCIYDCPQLQSLPADGLPPCLSELEIIVCPLLYERCKDESGLDWHKIKHIPHKEIFSEIGKDEFGSDSSSSDWSYN